MTSPTHFTAREMSVLAEAFRLANLLVAQMLDDMRPHDLDGQRWRDTRVALDPREHCGEVIDMTATALAWAEDTGLIVRHPQRRYLVRMTRPAPLQARAGRAMGVVAGRRGALDTETT